MASCTTGCCYVGRGDFYIRERFNCCATPAVTQKPFRALGNVSSFTWTSTITEIKQKNFGLAGGTACLIQQVESLDFKITLHCFTGENIGIGFLSEGTDNNVPAVVVNNEAIDAGMVKKGFAFPLAYSGFTGLVLTTVGGGTVYTLGVDYTVSGNMVLPVRGGAIVDGVALQADYSAPIQTRVELLTQTGKEWDIMLDGLNDATGDPVRARLYRVKFAADGVEFINDTSVASFTLSGTALTDECAPTTPFVVGLAPSTYGYVQLA